MKLTQMFAVCVLLHLKKIQLDKLVLSGCPVLVEDGSMKTVLKISKLTVMGMSAVVHFV